MSFYKDTLDGNVGKSSNKQQSDHFMSSRIDKFTRLAEELQPNIDGDVYVRSSEDDKQTSPSLSPKLDAMNDEKKNDIDVEEDGVPESDFSQSTRVFNAAAPLLACMVVRPRHTKDVVTTIKFCQTHQLSPSVKSGGFSTAGWSIQGDVVLDMRLMDSIEMMLPATFKGRDGTKVDISMDDRANPEAEFNATLDGTKGDLSLSRGKGGLGTSIKTDRASEIDRRSQREECKAGDSNISKDELRSIKRRKSNATEAQPRNEAQSNIQSLTNAIPSKSSESGGEADSESSSGGGASHGINSARSSPSRDNDGVVQSPTGILNNDDSKIPNTDAHKKDWTSWLDRDSRTTSGSQSGSTGSMSRSATSNPTSGDADSEEKEGKVEKQNVLPPMNWDPTSTFEHERWQRYHCPPGVAVNRVQLPSTGGFTWTSDNNGTINQSNTGNTLTLNNTSEPVYMGGSTLSDLQATSRTDLSPDMSRADLQSTGEMNMDWSACDGGSSSLPPGIHKDKYSLVELGPGVGIRAVDTFTDRAGRIGEYESTRGKGKARQNIESAAMGEKGLDIVARGVAYHVPLSAYPVGSTAMTTGGFGYLSRAYGLSLDNLVEVEIVLADGRVMVLNDSSKTKSEEEANLWWAVRGAAPCFGVVTRMVAKAYPVPRVYSGNLIFPFNPVTAPSLLRHWRDCLKGTGESVPRELYSNIILTAGPPGGAREHVIVVQICFLGTSASDDIGHTFVQAMSSWTGERVLLKDMAEKSFLNQQDGVAQVLKSGNGRRWMVRGDLLSTLTDEVIYKTVDHFHQMGSNRAVWFFELIGGAIEDEKDTCVGAEQRHARFTVAALQQWLGEDEDVKCVSGVDRWVKDVLSSVSIGGPFACFLERQESKERCQGAFGVENFENLLQIKRSVDPQGMFKHTFAGGLTEYM